MDNQNQPNQQTIIVVGKQKSVGAAFILAFFFGPLGLLYASVVGGIVMFFVSLLVGIVTFGFGLFFPWVACVIWAVVAANSANRKFLEQASIGVLQNGNSQSQVLPKKQREIGKFEALFIKLSSYISLAGFIMIIPGSYCPLLRPFHLFNYDLFDLSKPYGMVVLLMSVIGILAGALDRRPLLKIAAYVTLGLVVLIFIGAFFQVKSEFNFIPFKGIASGLSNAIKFKWGWYPLFTGAILAVAGTFGTKPNTIKQVSI